MKLDKLWQRIHEMSEAELEAYAEKHKVNMTEVFNDQRHAADYLCAQLGIEKSEESK